MDCAKDVTCMHLIIVYGTHMHTTMCEWIQLKYFSEGKLHSYADSPRSLFTSPCHHSLLSESFSKSYAAPQHPSLQCKLRRDILRGFLCGSQVKNWPACQIIISVNERLNRIPQRSSLWAGSTKHKGHPLLTASQIRYLTPKYYFLTLCMGFETHAAAF